MSQRFEGSIRSFDQTELFFQLWAADQARGTVIITHGLAEHSECYHALARALQTDQWEVYGWDLRGHGRSEGKRGFVRNFRDYIVDLKAIVEMVAQKRRAGTPLVLFGHSMGGLITTLLTLDWANDNPTTGLVLGSPLFDIALPVPAIKNFAAKVALKWVPSLTLHNEIKYTDLTRDETMLKSYDRDVLRHDKISPAVYWGMIDGFAAVRANAEQIKHPVLMLLAGNDRIVSTPAAQEIFRRLPNKRNVLEIFPESMHEIFNDLDRDQATQYLKKFINQLQGAT